MSLELFHELESQVSKVNVLDLDIVVRKNIKKYRKEKYQEFKRKNPYSTFNPFSCVNFADLLGYSEGYYRRLEGAWDKHITISMRTVVLASVIMDRKIGDFVVDIKV